MVLGLGCWKPQGQQDSMIQLYIGERDYSNRLDITSIKLTDTIKPLGDLLTFKLNLNVTRGDTLPQTEEVAKLYFYPDFDPVADPTATDRQLRFLGVIKTINFTWNGGFEVDLDIEAQDPTIFLERKYISGTVIDGVSSGTASGLAIKQILTSYAPGFAAHVLEFEDGESLEVEPQDFDFVKVTEAIQRYADMTERVWWVDTDLFIHYVTPFTNLASAPIFRYNADTEQNYGGLRVSISSSELRNVTIFKDYSIQSGNFYYEGGGSDVFSVTLNGTQGTTERYSLTRGEPVSLDDITVEIETSAGSGSYDTWTPRFEVDQPEDAEGQPGNIKEYFVAFRGNTSYIRFPKAWSSTTAGANSLHNRLAKIQYKYVYKTAVPALGREVYSISEMKRRERQYNTTLATGEYEYVTPLSGRIFKSLDDLINETNRTFRYFAWPRVNGSFIVRGEQSAFRTWKAGQTFEVSSNAMGLYDIEEWVKSGHTTKKALRVFVTQVDTSFINGEEAEYIISFSNVPN